MYVKALMLEIQQFSEKFSKNPKKFKYSKVFQKSELFPKKFQSSEIFPQNLKFFNKSKFSQKSEMFPKIKKNYLKK